MYLVTISEENLQSYQLHDIHHFSYNEINFANVFFEWLHSRACFDPSLSPPQCAVTRNSRYTPISKTLMFVSRRKGLSTEEAGKEEEEEEKEEQGKEEMHGKGGQEEEEKFAREKGMREGQNQGKVKEGGREDLAGGDTPETGLHQVSYVYCVKKNEIFVSCNISSYISSFLVTRNMKN